MAGGLVVDKSPSAFIQGVSMTLKEYRQKYTLSLVQLADKLDMDKAQLCKYLGGSRSPSLETAKKIEVKTEGEVPMEAWLK